MVPVEVASSGLTSGVTPSSLVQRCDTGDDITGLSPSSLLSTDGFSFCTLSCSSVLSVFLLAAPLFLDRKKMING